jgi:hypothetical protein
MQEMDEFLIKSNQLNNSTSKMKYSFPKSRRFYDHSKYQQEIHLAPVPLTAFTTCPISAPNDLLAWGTPTKWTSPRLPSWSLRPMPTA